MVLVLESYYCRNVRLFRWNEDLFKNKISDSEGLALFAIASVLETLFSPNQDFGAVDIELCKNLRPCVVPFNLSELLARDQNLGPKLVHATQQFSPNTVESLGDLISNYLFTRFQFDPQTVLGPNSPKTVIVVEVVRPLIVYLDYTHDRNVGISQFLPPEIPPPRWALEGRNEDEDEDVDDNEEAGKDSWESYGNDIQVFLWAIKKYLGVRRGRRRQKGRRTRRAITGDEPRGFVEISPVVIGRKRKREFDRTVDECAICLEDFVGVDDEKISTTSCFHIFHKKCILRWLLFNKNSCPTCRLVLPLGFDMMD